MTIPTTSTTFHRTARLGICVLIGVAALTACGEGESNVAAGPGSASPAKPTAVYVAPEQADRAAQLAVRNADAISRPVTPYVSPEQADRAAMLAVRNSADAIDGRATAKVVDRSADLDLATALERAAAAEQTSAHTSADALDHQSEVEHTSAHASADALEHWALSGSGS